MKGGTKAEGEPAGSAASAVKRDTAKRGKDQLRRISAVSDQKIKMVAMVGVRREKRQKGRMLMVKVNLLGTQLLCCASSLHFL